MQRSPSAQPAHLARLAGDARSALQLLRHLSKPQAAHRLRHRSQGRALAAQLRPGQPWYGTALRCKRSNGPAAALPRQPRRRLRGLAPPPPTRTCSSRRMYSLRSTRPCRPSGPSCCGSAAAAAAGAALPFRPLCARSCLLLVMSSLSLGRFAEVSSVWSSLRPAPLIPRGGTSQTAGRRSGGERRERLGGRRRRRHRPAEQLAEGGLVPADAEEVQVCAAAGERLT